MFDDTLNVRGAPWRLGRFVIIDDPLDLAEINRKRLPRNLEQDNLRRHARAG
jgi:hypothetical protein